MVAHDWRRKFTRIAVYLDADETDYVNRLARLRGKKVSTIFKEALFDVAAPQWAQELREEARARARSSEGVTTDGPAAPTTSPSSEPPPEGRP